MRICVPNFHCEDPSALRESYLLDDRSGDEAISAVGGGQAYNGEIASPTARNDREGPSMSLRTCYGISWSRC